LKKKPAEPAVALRRGRQPVNPESDFTAFKNSHKIGSKLEGEVTAFTSHGAVIKVKLRGSKHVECYAPTTSLGTPAPARARDVLKRGDHRTFRLVTVDSERRIAELALA
jgi:ribosomal protein S1